MRGLRASAAAVMLVCILLSAGAAYSACNWGGRWKTNWGLMTLRQQGDHVDGDYQGGRIPFATVDGQSVSGRWERDDGRSVGWFRFNLSGDCNSFKGNWGWNQAKNDPQPTNWSGKRVQPIRLLPPSDKSQPLGSQSQGEELPSVASIRGYGINYADGSQLCFASDYPVVEAAIEERNCVAMSPRLTAAWRGAYSLQDWVLYLEVRSLRCPAPPEDRIGIGYTVTLKNAKFTDGKKTKTIVVYQFQGRPVKQYIKVSVPIFSE